MAEQGKGFPPFARFKRAGESLDDTALLVARDVTQHVEMRALVSELGAGDQAPGIVTDVAAAPQSPERGAARNAELLRNLIVVVSKCQVGTLKSAPLPPALRQDV